MKNKPRLLLHCCCGPCSSNVVGELQNDFDVVLYYYNPCIYPSSEYDKRLQALETVAKHYKVRLIIENYQPDSYFNLINGLENEKEGGKRCESCIQQRLKKTCDYALKNGFDFFATTLSVSPHKNSTMINQIGYELAQDSNIQFLDRDFKQNNGFNKSIRMSKILNLYRQNYCGCKFSIRIPK